MQKFATTLRFTLLLLALGAAAAFAQVASDDAPQQGPDVFVRMGGLGGNSAQSANIAGVVYDNSAASVIASVTSTSLTSTWGDELFTTGPGVLSSMKFTILNSASSAGPLLTANVAINLFDGSTLAFIGGYTTSINFGTGLATGFFSTITVTGIDPLNITLNTSDVIVTQQVTSRTGTASRLGVVMRDPPSVGSSVPSFYANSPTIGAAGWYTVAAGNANPSYQVTLSNLPVPAKKSSWGRIKSLYR